MSQVVLWFAGKFFFNANIALVFGSMSRFMERPPNIRNVGTSGEPLESVPIRLY